jgi:DNA-directed RNA polymerase subunit beta
MHEKVAVRCKGDFLEVDPKDVHFMDISPKQLVSVAAALIPFLEHDDANRALMGSNMQRQGVPLLVSEAPIIGTGMEGKVARDSRAVIVADGEGKVASVTARPSSSPRRRDRRRQERSEARPREGRVHLRAEQVHALERGHLREPAPNRQEGPEGQEGDVLADGPNCENGELALGRNVLVAFMPGMATTSRTPSPSPSAS